MKRNCTTFLIFKLFFLLFLFHLPITSFSSESAANEKYYIIPLEFIDNSPYITVTIENKPVKLIVDTGTDTAIYLRKRILNNLKNKKYTGQYDRSMDAGGKIQKKPYFILNNIKASHYEITNVTGIEYEPWGINITGGNTSHANNSTREDGVVGLKFFQKNNVILDYPNKRLLILKSGTNHPNYINRHWNSSALDTSKNSITLKGFLDGRPYKFMLDTGATGSIFKKAILSDHLTRGRDTILFKNFSISGKNVGPIKFWLFDLADSESRFDGLLGHDFLSQNVIFLDFQNKIIKIS